MGWPLALSHSRGGLVQPVPALADRGPSHRSSGCLCVLGISVLTSDLLPKPGAQITSCLPDIPLGSWSAQHLEFKASNIKRAMYFPHPTCSSSSRSRLSKWHPAAQAKKRKGGESRRCPWFLSVTPHPGPAHHRLLWYFRLLCRHPHPNHRQHLSPAAISAGSSAAPCFHLPQHQSNL